MSLVLNFKHPYVLPLELRCRLHDLIIKVTRSVRLSSVSVPKALIADFNCNCLSLFVFKEKKSKGGLSTVVDI